MNELISVIIPCYNSERWLREAIDSALAQNYPSVEVIVIDDGSKDSSLEIIKSYGEKVVWDTGPNRGGNHARNRGFALSRGNFIQYLDADDYLLPQKIERQVAFLEKTEADVVYGDWRHKCHLPNGESFLEEIRVSGEQSDILESLLADWWISPASLLMRRSAVDKVGGWNEALRAGQDRDFFLSLVMSGATVVYQPGCYSVYRRYGDITVSTSSRERYIESHLYIVKKAEESLIKGNKLSNKYRCALAQSYFKLARCYLSTNYAKYLELLDKVIALCPNFRPSSDDRTAIYNFARNIIGFRNLERLVAWFKSLKQKPQYK